MRRFQPYVRLGALILVLGGIAAWAGWQTLVAVPPGPSSVPVVAEGYGGCTAAVEFPTPDLGWIVQVNAEIGRAALLQTADGGKHWQKQLNLPYPGRRPCVFGLTEPELKLKVWDLRHAMLTMPRSSDGVTDLYRTSDGGAHWERFQLPGNGIHSTDFTDMRRGWLLATPMGTSQTGAQVYRTEDAGEHWILVSDAATNGLSSDSVKIGIRFMDATTGWIGSQGQGLAPLYATYDGGHTWQQQLLPPLPGLDPEQISSSSVGPPEILADRSGILPIRAIRATSDRVRPSELYLSFASDGGKHWLPPRRAPDVGLGPMALGLLDDRHWWLLETPKVLHTDDRGVSWRASPMTLAPDLLITRLDLVTPEQAWAIAVLVCPPRSPRRECLEPPINASKTKLLRTSDGGSHWTEVPTPGVS